MKKSTADLDVIIRFVMSRHRNENRRIPISDDFILLTLFKMFDYSFQHGMSGKNYIISIWVHDPKPNTGLYRLFKRMFGSTIIVQMDIDWMEPGLGDVDFSAITNEELRKASWDGFPGGRSFSCLIPNDEVARFSPDKTHQANIALFDATPLRPSTVEMLNLSLSKSGFIPGEAMAYTN